MIILGLMGLMQLRTTMLEERQAQIRLILDYSEAQLAYFHGQEKDGKMSRSEAQQRAREAIGAQRKGDDYIFVRSIADDVMLVHANPSRIGKVDLGTKLPDGRHYCPQRIQPRIGRWTAPAASSCRWREWSQRQRS